MGVVVLHLDQRQPLRRRPRCRMGAGAIAGVQVAGERLGSVIEERGIIRLGPQELGPGQRLVEIAKVMRQQRLPALDQAERPLHLATHRQHPSRIGEPRGQRQRFRHAAARPAQDHRARGQHPLHPVIQPPHDVAVVHHEGVGKMPELFARLVIAGHLRFAREVARGHHQRAIEGVEQQMM